MEQEIKDKLHEYRDTIRDFNDFDAFCLEHELISSVWVFLQDNNITVVDPKDARKMYGKTRLDLIKGKLGVTNKNKRDFKDFSKSSWFQINNIRASKNHFHNLCVGIVRTNIIYNYFKELKEEE